jgi:anti-sigma factor RsiW
MSTNTIAHQHDWDAQRERLSAYLDNELSEAERIALAEHVAGCARCTAELAELQQIVSLLGALPAPQVPRSFTLPAATAPHPMRRVHARRWAAATQWAGGLAAAAGFFLLLGSALAGFGPHLAASPARQLSGAAQGGSTSQTDQQGTPRTSPSVNPTQYTSEAPTGSAVTPGASLHATTPAGSTNVPPSAAATPPVQPSSVGPIEPAQLELPIAGATLLVSGMVAFALGRRASRRRA